MSVLVRYINVLLVTDLKYRNTEIRNTDIHKVVTSNVIIIVYIVACGSVHTIQYVTQSPYKHRYFLIICVQCIVYISLSLVDLD